VAVTLDELQASVQRVSGQDFDLHTPQWLSRFSNETRLAERYRKDRIFLVGDAAHIHFPAGGQGMNVGMQDAMNLGWKLAGVVNHYAPASLLDSYHAERHPVGAKLVQNTLAQSVLMMNCFDSAGQALRQSLSELLNLPALNRALARELSAFGVTYPASLSEPVPGWTSLSPWVGQRLPDGLLRADDASESSLYSHLRGGKWLALQLTAEGTRFVPPLDEAWVKVVRAIPENRALELAGVDVLLIRPDGHIDQALASML
ncbi:MAG: FAD-dependent monooxygenase, partial [Rhodanobacter sp.]